MNRDVFEGRWKQIRGEIKRVWGDLTDDELDEIDGNADKLAGRLQERYGWTRARADEEINRFALDVNRRFGDQV